MSTLKTFALSVNVLIFILLVIIGLRSCSILI